MEREKLYRIRLSGSTARSDADLELLKLGDEFVRLLSLVTFV